MNLIKKGKQNRHQDLMEGKKWLGEGRERSRRDQVWGRLRKKERERLESGWGCLWDDLET